MPRRKKVGGVRSAFSQVQRQARSLLANLGKEIRIKESDLNRLKDEASRLMSLIGRRITGGGKGGRGGGRINWRKVLAKMPKQFKASDVRRFRGLKDKRPSEIFAAITRWIDAGLAKRKTRGLYEKV
jgi:hypothetical protein